MSFCFEGKITSQTLWGLKLSVSLLLLVFLSICSHVFANEGCDYQSLAYKRERMGIFRPVRKSVRDLLQALRQQLPQSDNRVKTLNEQMAKFLPEGDSEAFREFINFYLPAKYSLPADLVEIREASTHYSFSSGVMNKIREHAYKRMGTSPDRVDFIDSVFLKPWGSEGWRYEKDGTFIGEQGRAILEIIGSHEKTGESLSEAIETTSKILSKREKLPSEAYVNVVVRVISKMDFYHDTSHDVVRSLRKLVKEIDLSPSEVFRIHAALKGYSDLHAGWGRKFSNNNMNASWGAQGLMARDIIAGTLLDSVEPAKIESNPLLLPLAEQATSNAPNVSESQAPPSAELTELRELSAKVDTQLAELRKFAKAMGIEGEDALGRLAEHMRTFTVITEAIRQELKNSTTDP